MHETYLVKKITNIHLLVFLQTHFNAKKTYYWLIIGLSDAFSNR